MRLSPILRKPIPAINEVVRARQGRGFFGRAFSPTLEDVFVSLIENYDEENKMNLRRVNAVAKKEFIQIWRDPRSLALALVIPVLLIVPSAMACRSISRISRWPYGIATIQSSPLTLSAILKIQSISSNRLLQQLS